MIDDHFRLSKLTLSYTKALNKANYCVKDKLFFRIYSLVVC
jgi:hypothetical protein